MADHQDIARRVGARADDCHALLLALEHTRRAFVHQRVQPRDFDESTIRREVAFEHHHTACRRYRVARSPDHIAVRVGSRRTGLRQGFAADGERSAVEGTARNQCLRNHRHAADAMHVLRMIVASRPQVADRAGSARTPQQHRRE